MREAKQETRLISATYLFGASKLVWGSKGDHAIGPGKVQGHA